MVSLAFEFLLLLNSSHLYFSSHVLIPSDPAVELRLVPSTSFSLDFSPNHSHKALVHMSDITEDFRDFIALATQTM